MPFLPDGAALRDVESLVKLIAAVATEPARLKP